MAKMEKIDDTIIGNEDIKIGLFKMFVEESKYYIDEDGNKQFDGVEDVEKEFYYIFFKTESNIKYSYNDELADFCNIPLSQYINILREHGGKYYDKKDCHIFDNVKSIKKLIDSLAPYIVMNKLSANNSKPTIDKLLEKDITEDDDYWEGYSRHYADGRDVNGDIEPLI